MDDKKHFLVTLAFPRGTPTDEERSRQRDFLRRLQDEGTLLVAGQFPDDKGGGMSILTAGSLDAAHEIFGQSPLVHADRVEWSVREFKVTWGFGRP